VNDAGKCVSCQSVEKFGTGCNKCTVDTCTDCSSVGCASCQDGKQAIVADGDVVCGTCNQLTEHCQTCSLTECLSCDENMVVDSGKCKSCSELFNGCAECDSDSCKSCSNAEWIVTSNGCYEPDESKPSSSMPSVPSMSPSVSSVSPSTSSVSPKASSSGIPKPMKPSSSSVKKLSGGIIALIVVASLAVVVLIGLAIYCFIAKRSKHTKLVDNFNDEDSDPVYMSDY